MQADGEQPGNEEFVARVKEAMNTFNEQDPDATLRICRDLMARYPAAAEPYFVMGVLALRIGDEGQAIEMMETAHRIDPETREYALALANVCMRIGRLADGTYYAKVADMLPPHPILGDRLPTKLFDLGKSMAEMAPSTHIVEAERLFNLASFELALREAQAEIRLNAHNVAAYLLLGRLGIILGRFRQAVNALQAAIQLQPDEPLYCGLMARALLGLGQVSDARAVAERGLAMATRTADAEAYGQAMIALQRCPGVELATIREHADRFDAAFAAEYADDSEPPVPAVDAPPNIGMMSNVFYNTLAARNFQSWFQVKIKGARWTGYQQSVGTDVTTTVLKRGISDWREIYDLDPFTLNYTIRSENLDVLVDLQHPDGETRFSLAALGPCRWRVGAFAMPDPGFAPGTTHILSDEILADADRATLRDGQSLIEIRGSLFAQPPLRYLPQDTPLPAAERGAVNFAGMLDLTRLSAECALVWAEVLRETPKSRLLLICGDRLSDEVRERTRDYFSYAGVADRIDFVLGRGGRGDGEEEEVDDVLGRLNAVVPANCWREVDVFLDTLPWNTPHVIPEALWSGVPVVTLAGQRRQSRIGASMVAAAGRTDWIVRNKEEYVSCAAKLAADLPALAEERRRLQENVGTSRLFDADGTANQVATLLRELAGTGRQE